MARTGTVIVNLEEYRHRRTQAEAGRKGNITPRPLVPQPMPMMWFPMFTMVSVPVMTMVPYWAASPAYKMGWKNV